MYSSISGGPFWLLLLPPNVVESERDKKPTIDQVEVFVKPNQRFGLTNTST